MYVNNSQVKFINNSTITLKVSNNSELSAYLINKRRITIGPKISNIKTTAISLGNYFLTKKSYEHEDFNKMLNSDKKGANINNNDIQKKLITPKKKNENNNNENKKFISPFKKNKKSITLKKLSIDQVLKDRLNSSEQICNFNSNTLEKSRNQLDIETNPDINTTDIEHQNNPLCKTSKAAKVRPLNINLAIKSIDEEDIDFKEEIKYTKRTETKFVFPFNLKKSKPNEIKNFKQLNSYRKISSLQPECSNINFTIKNFNSNNTMRNTSSKENTIINFNEEIKPKTKNIYETNKISGVSSFFQKKMNYNKGEK